jgi:hypothetical protein
MDSWYRPQSAKVSMRPSSTGSPPLRGIAGSMGAVGYAIGGVKLRQASSWRVLPPSSSALLRSGALIGEPIVRPDRLHGWMMLAWNRKFADSSLEGGGFELVWGFSCQVVFFGLLPVRGSERQVAVLHPVACDQVPGARAMGSRDRNASKAWRRVPSGAGVWQRLDA